MHYRDTRAVIYYVGHVVSVFSKGYKTQTKTYLFETFIQLAKNHVLIEKLALIAMFKVVRDSRA